MSKLKIIVISTCFPRKSIPGNGIFIYQQINALAQLGVECHVIQPINWFPPFGLHKFHPYWQTGYVQSQDMRNDFPKIKMHHPRIFAKYPGRFFKEEHWSRIGKALARYVTRHKDLKDSDLIYAHFLCNEGYSATYIKQSTSIPLVAIARGDDVHAWPENDQEAANHLLTVFDQADLLLANSTQLANDAQAWMKPGAVREVHTIYNGVNVSKFRPILNLDEKHTLKKKYDLDLASKYLICVATPVVLKGWMELLNAWAQSVNILRDWKLIAVMPRHHSPETINIEEIASELGILPYCKLYESLTHDKLIELYQASDAFVLPSYNEGMSNALLEALACGLPVLATNVGGHAEVIKSGKNGFLINPKSVDSMVDALASLAKLSNDELLQMGKAAREAAVNIGTYEENAHKLLNLFNKLLKRN